MLDLSQTPWLIPVRRVRAVPGVFRWPARPRMVSVRQEDALPLGQLADDLTRALGRPSTVGFGAGEKASVLLGRTPGFGPEAYRMDLAPGGVTIEASTDAGAYYAVQTLRALLKVHGARLPCGRIDDAPDFPRRGLYHDCSRGKVPTVETVKALIERLAHWKVNELQLYIENVFTFRRHPAIGRGYDPFTPDDLLEIQAHAEKHHLRLVPSLASFGHMELILALPAYRALGELPGAWGRPGGTTLCPGDPGSLRLIETLYAEFLPLFKAVDFNLCADETWELGKGRSRRRAARVGVGRVYLDFLRKLHRLCERHGKRMNAWADIALQHPELLKEFPRDAALLNWDYEAEGRRLARTGEIAVAGLARLVCPGTGGWKSHGTRLAVSMANVARASVEGRKHGAEGLLLTDWGDQGHRNLLGASLHAFAHGAAHAWHGAAVDETAFTERFGRHVFGGRDARLADALRLLGRTGELGGGAAGPASAYALLVEPLRPGADFQRGLSPASPVRVPPLHRYDVWARLMPARLREAIERLDGAWSLPAPRGLPPFEQLAWHELRLAALMDRLAAARGELGLAQRAGRPPAAAELRRHADAYDALADAFATLWLSRNRPSRLQDNLHLFRRAALEARALAGLHTAAQQTSPRKQTMRKTGAP